ncbi:unnamed protein product [Haemonchus placei]|uniref:Amino_oxidase domain-containing protein n=1 Tax=Haemonchus placei TaxID=6290 RepID=A0A0N4X7G5_HAEPC|nr:unnamed protein product [Haemonchus placei]
MEHSKGKRFVIIGSGPTALGAAYRLHELIQNGELPSSTQVTVLEKEIEVGGLARSVTDRRGFTWDLGVHVTGYSKYPKFTHLLNRTVRHWNNVPRCVKGLYDTDEMWDKFFQAFSSTVKSGGYEISICQAYMRHVIQDDDNVEANYVPYPVQDSIPYFPEEVKLRCLDEISSQAVPSKKAENFDDFTANTFGETLQAIFIRPYNEKVWTVTLDEMNCVWVENRVPRTNIEDLTRRCSRKQRKGERIRLRDINDAYRGVGQDNFALPEDQLEPFKVLVGLLSISASQVVLVGIGMRRPQPEFTEQLSWLYFPQPDIIFYRCTFMSNFNERLTPNAVLFWSVLVEIGMSSDEDVNEHTVIDCTIKDLIEHGIIYPTSRIESTWLHVLPYGYPIPTLNRDRELQKAHESLEAANIYSRGRFGSWRYEAANQDHSFTMGSDVVDRLVYGTEETL